MNIACTPTFFFSTFFFLFFLFFSFVEKRKIRKINEILFPFVFFYLFYASHFAFYMRDTFLIISIFENYFTFKLFNKKKHLNTLLHTLRTNIHYTTAPLVSVWLWKRTFFWRSLIKIPSQEEHAHFQLKKFRKKEMIFTSILTFWKENRNTKRGKLAAGSWKIFWYLKKKYMFVHFFVTITVWEFSS